MILPRQGFKANGRALIALGPLCNVINFGITRSSLFWHQQDPEQVKGFLFLLVIGRRYGGEQTLMMLE